MKLAVIILCITTLTGVAVCHADEATCDFIRAAYQKTGSVGTQMKHTGYDYAMDTPDIYGPGEHACVHVGDDVVDGQPVAVYREEYRAARGHTVALLSIAKASGRVLREVQDGTVVGKGSGRIVYTWPAGKP